MKTYTVTASFPLDCFVNHTIEAESGEDAIAKVKALVDAPDFWSDQEFDFDTSGDVSYKAEFDADIVEAEERGNVHRLNDAAKQMLIALLLAKPFLIGERDHLLKSYCVLDKDLNPRRDTLDEDGRPHVEAVEEVLALVEKAITAANGTAAT